MAGVLTVTPNGLGSFASGSVLSLKQHVGRSRARSSLVTAACSSSSGSGSSADNFRFVQDGTKHLKTGAERLVQNTRESEFGKALAPIAVSAALYMQAAGPALAEVAETVPVEVVDDSQYWTEVLLTSGAAGILYLVVFPLIIFNYLRLRWYKRNALETYFQFMLVFIFFPGLLLLAPFINFRRLPKEGTEAP